MSEELYSSKKESVCAMLAEVRENIKALALQDVRICAATKTVPTEIINYAHRECGLLCIGENRVNELLQKYSELDRDIELHFIGRLQTNKVKYIVDKVSMIQSLDSVRLALEIEKQCAKRNIVMDVLVEVNVGGEENKGGVSPAELYSLADEIASLEHLSLKGLMIMIPKCSSSEEVTEYFTQSYELFIDFCKNKC